MGDLLGFAGSQADGDRSPERNLRIAAAAGAGAIQRLAQIASTLLVMPFLLRGLGTAKFGIWGAAVSLAWLSAFADVGTGAALVTLIARSNALGDTRALRRQVASALTLGCALAGLALLGAFVAWKSALFHTDSYLLFTVVAGLGINIPLSAANSIWMALQKGYFAGFWELIQTLLTTAGLLMAAAWAPDIRICVAVVYVSLVVANMGSLTHLFLSHPETRPAGLMFRFKPIRELAGQGMLYFIMGLAGSSSFLFDNVLGLALLGPQASARITIALRICVAGLGALAVISQPLWPAFTEAAEMANRIWIRKTLLIGSLTLVGVTLAGCVVLVIWGERLLRFWLSDDLGFGAGLFFAIALWLLTQAGIRLPHLLLNAVSIVRFQILVFSVTTLVAFGLKFALSPYLGVAGILWGTTLSVIFVALPAFIWRIIQWNRSLPAGPTRVGDWRPEQTIPDRIP